MGILLAFACGTWFGFVIMAILAAGKIDDMQSGRDKVLIQPADEELKTSID